MLWAPWFFKGPKKVCIITRNNVFDHLFSIERPFRAPSQTLHTVIIPNASTCIYKPDFNLTFSNGNFFHVSRGCAFVLSAFSALDPGGQRTCLSSIQFEGIVPSSSNSASNQIALHHICKTQEGHMLVQSHNTSTHYTNMPCQCG